MGSVVGKYEDILGISWDTRMSEDMRRYELISADMRRCDMMSANTGSYCLLTNF